MNIVKRFDQYDENNLFFCEPIKNNIMNDGNFIRILYSTPNFTLNGIYLLVNINDIACEKYYLKYKCTFNVNTHKNIIDNLKLIEDDILKKWFDKITGCICQTEWHKDIFINTHPILKDKIHIINNGLSLEKFKYKLKYVYS